MTQSVSSFPVSRIRVDRFQPRLSVDIHLFEGLCRSLKDTGMIHAILVRAADDGRDPVLISGHRRLLAAKHLGWDRVPVRILNITEAQAMHLRLTENLQREAMLPLELAEAVERYALSCEARSKDELAHDLALDPAALEASLQLLKVTPEAREQLIYGLDQKAPMNPEALASLQSSLSSRGTPLEMGDLA